MQNALNAPTARRKPKPGIKPPRHNQNASGKVLRTNTQLYGYDLDGVIYPNTPKRPKPYSQQTKEEREAYDKVRQKHYMYSPVIMKPVQPYIFITGRSPKYSYETWQNVLRSGLYPAGIYFMGESRTRENMIKHKVKTCRNMLVTMFFEDDRKIVLAMRKAGINVQWVKRR